MLDNSCDRVKNETVPYVNARIDMYTRSSIGHYSKQGRDAMLCWIFELDWKCDIDRALMINCKVDGKSRWCKKII